MIQAGLDYSKNWDAETLYRPVPQVQKVRRTYRKSNPKGKLIVKTGLALFLYALVLVYLCFKGAALGYQIVELERDIHQLETSNQRAAYSISEKQSLAHIEAAAANLGMQKPGQGIMIAASAGAERIMVDQPNTQSGPNQAGGGPLKKLYKNLVVLAQNNL